MGGDKLSTCTQMIAFFTSLTPRFLKPKRLRKSRVHSRGGREKEPLYKCNEKIAALFDVVHLHISCDLIALERGEGKGGGGKKSK